MRDGAGRATTSLRVNEDGGVGPTVTPAATYSVASDGGATLSIGANTLTGGVLLGGDLVLLSGSTTATTAPVLMVLVRQSSGASAANLSGSYFVVALAQVAGYMSLEGTAVADGAGSLTGTVTRNDDGVLTSGLPLSDTYTVAADGTLRLTSSTETAEGGVSPDGRFAVVGGATDAASPTQILFLLR